MGYDLHPKLRVSIKFTQARLGVLVVLFLLILGFALSNLWPMMSGSHAAAFVVASEPERWLTLPEPAGVCQRWEADWPPKKPGPELMDVSGIVSSRVYRNILYQIADSGHDPFILVTDLKGHVMHRIRYADSVSDPEALSQGPCPWGGSCLFVADTGDHFHLRSKKRIHAIDERSMFSPAVHSAELEFQYPQQDRLDVEALAVHPASGDMFLFSKEPNRSLVFRLPAKAWQQNNGDWIAEQVGFFLYGLISDAAWSPDGKRLLLINPAGLFERTGQADAEHSEREGWLPYERRIRLPSLSQQQAVTYLPDQRSIAYSAGRKFFIDRDWGLVLAACIAQGS